MSTPWLSQALVGVTDTASLPSEGELGVFLAKLVLAGDDAALTFSNAMGALASCKLAAVVLVEPIEQLPAPALPDLHVLADTHPWTEWLDATFAQGPLRLQYEACSRVAAMQASLPTCVLAEALDGGKRSRALRAELLAVIGKRGHWLAQFNSDWSYVGAGVDDMDEASDQQLWEQGNLAQRVASLSRLRRRDPATARERLRAQLSELPAKERLELVNVLEHGLGADDEAVLEPLLKDRSRDVRYRAARLLALLPQSAQAQRLTGWLAQLLTIKRSLLSKSWECDAPLTADPVWATAAIDASRPTHESLGERAWWLYQIVRQVALPWWETHTGMRPDALLAWASKSDWKAALYRAWSERVGPNDGAWIEAMLATNAAEFASSRSALLAMLPVAQREKHWPPSLNELRKTGALNDVTAACALGETLSLQFSRALIDDLHVCLSADTLRHDYALRAQVLELATCLHLDSLVNWKAPARPSDETPAMAECLREFERIVATRQTLHSRPL